MRAIWTLTRMTWTELLRDKIVALLAFVAFFQLLLAMFLGSLSLDEQVRLLVHLGFAGFEITLVGLAVFLGSWTLQKELDRQTCLVVLSRPVGRGQFLIGKWAGALLMIAVFWVASGLLHLVLLNFAFDFGRYAEVFSTILFEAAFVLCLAFFFASWLRPLLAMAFTLTVWIGGHWKEDFAFFAKRGSQVLKAAIPVVEWALPPLDRLDVRSVHALENHESLGIAWPLIHLFFWSALVLFFAQIIWRRRDLV